MKFDFIKYNFTENDFDHALCKLLCKLSNGKRITGKRIQETSKEQIKLLIKLCDKGYSLDDAVEKIVIDNIRID